MDLDWNLTAAATETSWAHAAVRVATGGALVASGKTSGYKRSDEKEGHWKKTRMCRRKTVAKTRKKTRVVYFYSTTQHTFVQRSVWKVLDVSQGSEDTSQRVLVLAPPLRKVSVAMEAGRCSLKLSAKLSEAS